MESEVPLCLIENVKGRLRANQKALEVLSAITQPVVVVAIVGLYRTGKSYLMNKLAGKRIGFTLGSTVQSHTKGIWMWCLPHPQKPDHTLVLLDTEGLGDVEKGDIQNDCWIFALAILLSSTFVYNSMGVINQQAMDQLHYVTELSDKIQARSSHDQDDGQEDSADFVSFFPDFMWTLRDVTLRLEADGRSLTADEYLEYSLKLKKGTSEDDKKYNLPRLCIQKFFPKKKCFVFYPPAEWKKLSELESLQDEELDSDFVRQAEDFCSFIFSSSKAKTLPGSIKVNGTRLGILVQTYLDAISNGTVPCLENAVTTLAQLTNSAAVEKAAEHYSKQVAKQVRLPTDTLQELLDVHAACEKEAIAVFMEHSFKDDQLEFQKQLLVNIEERKETFMRQNEAASLSHCQAELDKLSEFLRENILHGVFSVPGGHSLYLKARKKVEQDYERVPRKGVKVKTLGQNELLLNNISMVQWKDAMNREAHIDLPKQQASEVFQNFLNSQITMEESILNSDKALTESQKALEAEKTKKEAAEKKLELSKQQQKETEEKMEALKKSISEAIGQMEEKILKEKDSLLREQERVLDLKMKALEKLVQEGLEGQCEDLKKDIKLREEQIRAMKENSASGILEGTIGFFRELLLNVLSSQIKRALREM